MILMQFEVQPIPAPTGLSGAKIIELHRLPFRIVKAWTGPCRVVARMHKPTSDYIADPVLRMGAVNDVYGHGGV